MKITRIIGLDTLGDDNTADDNVRYSRAVARALALEYPTADIAVSIADHSKIEITDIDFDPLEIVENVQNTCNEIWNNADY